jgi:hypothetical protein
MLLWIESQPTPVIAVLDFALCYALAAIVFFVTATMSRRLIADQLKATTPVMLTPLAIIFSSCALPMLATQGCATTGVSQLIKEPFLKRSYRLR